MRKVSWSAVFVIAGAVAAADKPRPPDEAAGAMTLPPGFRATLFAGEPHVVQPIAFTFDDRGRMWVIECLSYPKWHRGNARGSDRVSILEDTDGDGTFDKKTIFLDDGTNLSGIELGFGGVWLCATPHLLFVPDRNHDDKPDGPPQIVLDGWDIEARHNVFNGLRWGPDGWLYGCNGILSNSKVGKPGTPADRRVAINCGVWRYHPTRQVFEAFAHGTTNPWGLDFDDHGQCFITNCVIHHLFHVVQGGHYERMFGQDLNPQVYGLMKSCADHIHWGGGHWTSSRGGQGVHDDPGGGHAHSGCMIYLGESWPAAYRGRVFMCNIHGSRINQDLLERKRSTCTAKHGPDFLKANDDWFRGIAIHQGPDGSAFVSDWCDTGECHNYEVADKTNGRIYKIAYGKPKPFTGDLSKLSDTELARLQASPNEWLVRHARRLLQERAAAGPIDPSARRLLFDLLRNADGERVKLRALWTLFVAGQFSPALAAELMGHDSEHLRAWSVRLSADAPAANLSDLLRRAAADSSALVGMAAASALQRGTGDADILELCCAANQAWNDPTLTLMLWYAAERLSRTTTAALHRLLSDRSAAVLRVFAARRIAELDDPRDVSRAIARLVDLPDRSRADVLSGLREGWKGRRSVPMPENWPSVYAALRDRTAAEVREQAMAMAVLFDDANAVAELKRLLPNRSAELAERRAALHALAQKQSPDLVALAMPLLDEAGLRAEAIRALSAYADDAIPGRLIALYPQLSAAEKADALQTLAARPPFALALVDAVEKGVVPRSDITVVLVRQLLALKNADIAARLEKVWGTLRPATRERRALIDKYRQMLAPGLLAKADLTRGRTLFQQHCAACHKLFGEGVSLGPELTGGQRKSLDYLLENVVDPNAVVAREYLVHIVETKNGRVLSGIIKEESERAVTLQTAADVVVIPKDEIADRTATKTSMMPEGIFDKLTPAEIRDLAGYLAADEAPGAKR